jgi:hypothetical protein
MRALSMELKEQRQEVMQELKERRQLLLSQQRLATYD